VVDFNPENDPTEIHRCLAARAIMPRKGVKSLLDVGCGDGYFCHWIQNNRTEIARVVGVDVSESRLARARERYEEIEFLLAGTPKLPFEAGEFDIATCIEVLEHLEDPDAALQEIGRVSRQVVITVPDRQAVPMQLCPHCLRVFPASGHLHYFDTEHIAQMAKAAGLRLEKVESYHPNFFQTSNLFLRLPGRLLSRQMRLLVKRRGLFLTARMVNGRYA